MSLIHNSITFFLVIYGVYCEQYGKFPMHGGNKEKQQIAANSSLITEENVDNLETLCTYSESGHFGFMGYSVVDNDDNAYFTDTSGFKSVNITNCQLNWEITIDNMKTLLNESKPYPSLNTPALIQTNSGEHAVIFAYTSWEFDFEAAQLVNMTRMPYKGCYLAAIRLSDASLLWKATIYDKLKRESATCIIHGVQIDGGYAYGGTSNHAYGLPLDLVYGSEPMIWRGKAFKVDINTGELVNEWYALPENDINTIQTEGMYNGGSMYPNMAIIDDYFVFGTSNLWNHPNRVEKCLLGDYSEIPLANANTYDICGNDRSDLPLYRCLEKGVYGTSIVILNKNTFALEAAYPTQGVSTWGNNCYLAAVGAKYGTITPQEANRQWYNNSFCSKYNVIPQHDWVTKLLYLNISTPGMNGDVNGVVGYHYEGKAYAAVSSKNGYLWVIELDSMQLKIAKQVAPWGNEGGATPFSLAVDEENMIAIFTQRGSGEDYFPYKYHFSDGTIGCYTGAVFAIDLKTGYTLWEWLHPFMSLNDECIDYCLAPYGLPTIDCMNHKNFDFDWGQCERAFDGTDMKDASETSQNVVQPPNNDEFEADTPPYTIYKGLIYEKRRGSMVGPATINNGMVFLPSLTGEIYIHNVLSGEHIHTIYCPEYQFKYDDNGTPAQHPNREGTRSGQTMFDNYLLFYCGATYVHPTDVDSSVDAALLQRGDLVVMRLPTVSPTSSPTTTTQDPAISPTDAPVYGDDSGDYAIPIASVNLTVILFMLLCVFYCF